MLQLRCIHCLARRLTNRLRNASLASLRVACLDSYSTTFFLARSSICGRVAVPFDLWARGVRVDAAGDNAIAVMRNVAVLEWIRDRITRRLDPVILTRIDVKLSRLRNSANDVSALEVPKPPTASSKEVP
jgi:hypothetical protein